MKKYDELSKKEKHNFKEFLVTTFKFSEDELAAIDKQKPMTMELFSSCLAKCTEYGLYKLFESCRKIWWLFFITEIYELKSGIRSKKTGCFFMHFIKNFFSKHCIILEFPFYK